MFSADRDFRDEEESERALSVTVEDGDEEATSEVMDVIEIDDEEADEADDTRMEVERTPRIQYVLYLVHITVMSSFMLQTPDQEGCYRQGCEPCFPIPSVCSTGNKIFVMSDHLSSKKRGGSLRKTPAKRRARE